MSHSAMRRPAARGCSMAGRTRPGRRLRPNPEGGRVDRHRAWYHRVLSRCFRLRATLGAARNSAVEPGAG